MIVGDDQARSTSRATFLQFGRQDSLRIVLGAWASFQADAEAREGVSESHRQSSAVFDGPERTRLCYRELVVFVTKRLRFQVRAARLPQSVVRDTTIEGAF